MNEHIPVTMNGERVGWAEVEPDGGIGMLYLDDDSGFFPIQVNDLSIYVEKEKK